MFLLKHQGPKMYILVALTGPFALRASEAAMLRREDIHLEACPPYISIPKERGRGKSPGDVPIMPDQASLLRMWLTEGVTVDRTVKVNQNGNQTRHEKHKLPSSGRLFPCRQTTYKKKKVKQDHLGYHAVWSAIRKAAEAFFKLRPGVAKCWKQLRSHSGRSTKITMLMGEGVSLSMSMKFARHAQSSIKTHLQYGKLTVKDIHHYLLQERGRTADMLATQRRRTAQDSMEPILDKPLEQEAKEPSGAPRRRLKSKTCVQMQPTLSSPAMHPLADCSLKDAIKWHEQGLLDDAEFATVKRDMMNRVAASRKAD